MDLDYARRLLHRTRQDCYTSSSTDQVISVLLELLNLAGRLDQKLSQVDYEKKILEARIQDLERRPLQVGVDWASWPDRTVWRCTCGHQAETAGEMFNHLSTAHQMDPQDPALLGDPRRI